MINKLLLVTIILLSSCDPIIKTLGPLASPSVADSRKRGVFLKEYYPVDIKSFDTLDFDIKEAFAERQYSYTSVVTN